MVFFKNVFVKITATLLKNTLTQVLSYEFCERFKNTYSVEYLRMAVCRCKNMAIDNYTFLKHPVSNRLCYSVHSNYYENSNGCFFN